MSEATENNPIVGQDGPLESERSGVEQLERHQAAVAELKQRQNGGQRVEPEPGPYATAVAAYLDGADWLDNVLDAPLVVHARSIAQSLDKQLAAKGEVQSALAGSFDKCLFRLDSRRPRPAGAGEPGDPDQTTIFSFLDG